MGKALKGKRDKVFLMTKVCTHGRDRKVAMKQLEESLKRLQTDHLDLWQIHEVIYYNDPELAHARGGVLEALDEAKKQGKTRFVGFTGHTATWAASNTGTRCTRPCRSNRRTNDDYCKRRRHVRVASSRLSDGRGVRGRRDRGPDRDGRATPATRAS